jgi:hypothetical protein
MPERTIEERASDRDPAARRAAAERPATGARYTLDAARDAGYRALERLEDEMALVAPARRPELPAGGPRPR